MKTGCWIPLLTAVVTKYVLVFLLVIPILDVSLITSLLFLLVSFLGKRTAFTCDSWFSDNILAEIFQEAKHCLSVCRLLVISECIYIFQSGSQLGAGAVALSDHHVIQILVFGLLTDRELLHVG